MRSLSTAALMLAVVCGANAQERKRTEPIPVKVVVVAMFERGEDTGDTPGEYQYWVEREHLDEILPMPASFHHVRMNKDGVLGLLTGVGTARAAASVMALGLDPRFDLTNAYWVVAGIGGGDPADVSLGSAVWVDRVIDGDLAYEIDARQIPPEWPTGYVPLGKSAPYEQPMNAARAGLFATNPGLTAWALALTRNVPLTDTDDLKKFRARFAEFPNALRPPFITRGDQVTASTFWHGSKMEEWANAWARYYGGDRANYMVCGMEDSGTLQALAFLNEAHRVDLRRVLVLRTISNYDREAPGVSVSDSLKALSTGNYSAYLPALDAAEIVGDKVVRDIVTHWEQRAAQIPHAP
ncbi:MAG TPA: purine nucleoside permease [Candidatus Acidoferrum sp.]|nr:purine nucleoside permease [Candidatus Acidoferrum sp.]